MKKVFAFTLILAIFALPGYAEGDKTTLIQIESIDDLQKIGNDPGYPLDGDYVLVNDIDASATSGWNDGAGFAPIGGTATAPNSDAFSGTLDGGGFTISGLTINRSDEDEVGLFTRPFEATIQNLTLSDVTITGKDRVGALAGNTTESIVTNCHSTGAVTGHFAVGGLIGKTEAATTAYSSSGCTVVCTTSSAGGLIGWHVNFFDVTQGSHTYQSFATGDVTAENLVGGLLGYHTKSSLLEDAYASGTVTALRDEGVVSVGGIVGMTNYSSISKRCYSVGLVVGSSAHPFPEIGPVFGWSREDIDPGLELAYVEGIYYDSDTAGVSDNGIGTGRTTAQMQQAGTFIDWDFETVWFIDEGNEYPLLQAFLTTHTVTFDLDGKGERVGGGALSQTVPHGDAAQTPLVVGIDNWIFDGWDVAYQTVTGDLTVTAQFLPSLGVNPFLRSLPRDTTATTFEVTNRPGLA